MERWRKSLAARSSHRTSLAASNSTKRSIKKDTTMILKVNRQITGEPSNGGSSWKLKVPSSRKSIPRRLSYSNNDDSICLMNIGNNLDDTLKSTPMKLETVPVINILNFNESKKKANINEEEELGVKKDTLEYLRSIGVIRSPNSQKENKPPNLSAKVLSSAKKVKAPTSARKDKILSSAKKDKIISSAKKDNILLSAKKDKILSSVKKGVLTNVVNSNEQFSLSIKEKDQIQNGKELQRETNLASLELRVKEVLMRQTKEKSELREKYVKDTINLEKRHEEELMAIFNRSTKETRSELPAVFSSNTSLSESQISGINISQDSFLKSPYSGTWKVADNDNDDVFANDSLTLGFNTTSNMTINGTQILDTPATRRLVSQRITQGIETLLYG